MLLLSLLFVPLIGVVILLVMGNMDQTKAKNIAFATAILSLLLFIYAAFQFQHGNLNNLAFNKPWLPDSSISFKFTIDGISLLLLGLTSILIPLIVLSTFKCVYEKPNLFYALLLLTESTLIGVFCAGDLFLFYFFFEATLIPVYFLSLKWGNENAPKAALKMFLFTAFGSLFMLVALLYLYIKGQTSDMETLKATVQFLPGSIHKILFWGFILAFAIKMPLFPFHTWQPDAYAESPTVSTMLLAGLLSKMGVYGLLRIVLPFAPLGVQAFADILCILGVVGLIYGSIVAVKQDNIKRLLAYASFAHIGLMAAGVFSGTLEGLQGTVFQMLAHGINVVGLFFVAKIIFEKTGSRSLSALGGMSQDAPVLSIYFMIILLGNIALPLTNGFVGEFLMLKSLFDKNILFGVIAGFSVILSAVYMLRLFQKSMFGEKTNIEIKIADVSGSESWVLFVISGLVLVMGVFPNILLRISETTSQQLLDYLAMF